MHPLSGFSGGARKVKISLDIRVKNIYNIVPVGIVLFMV